MGSDDPKTARFEGWLAKMRQTGHVPLGSEYETFARKAWDAAITEEREACVKICDSLANDTAWLDRFRDGASECADVIRKRSL